MRLQPADHLLLRELIGWSESSFPSGSLNLSIAELARRTGMHRNSVQRRMAALREGGVLGGFVFEPRPGILGMVRAGHHFADIPVMTPAAFQKAMAPFPMISIAALHANSCFLHTWHDTMEEVEGTVEALRVALQASSAQASFVMAEPPDDLGALDRRIVTALRRGHRRSVADVAERAGTTRRTAARRIEGLMARGAGALMPVFRASAVEGEVLAIYDVQEWDQQTYDAVCKAFPDRIMGPMQAPVRPMAMVPLPSVPAASERLAVARETPGLEHLNMALARDFLFPEACDAWMATRVQIAPPPAATN